MKKLVILLSAAAICLCSCGEADTVAPELSVPGVIRHSQSEEFNIADYAAAEDNSGGEISLTYDGEIDVDKLGDYSITVTASDKSDNKTEKKVTVSVQKNRKKFSNDAICKSVREYIFDLQSKGHSNIAFKGYANHIGFFSCAYSAAPEFMLGEYPGELIFETVQYEDYKASSFNVVFFVRSDAMWYFPKEAELKCGGETIEISLQDTGEKNGMYGYYAVIDELSEKKDMLTPDFERIENLRKFAESSQPVILRCYNDENFFEYELNEANRKDFADMLNVYEELMTFY